MIDLPKETIEAVLALAAEGLPVQHVSFMARVSPATVRAVLEANAEGKPLNREDSSSN